MKKEAKSKGDILIVDDQPANLDVLMHMLADAGYHVRPAIDGNLALRAIQKQPPDLILLDIAMPHPDGLEVCRRLKADTSTKDIPIIFISALDDLSYKMKAFTAGGVDYITKPYQAEEVLMRVHTHLSLRAMQFELERNNDRLAREIQMREEVTQALRHSEERYRRLFHNNHSVMLLLHPDTGRIIDANPAACHFYGYTRDELLARTIMDINRVDVDDVLKIMDRVQREENNHLFFRHWLASGESREVEVFSGPVALDGQQLLFSIVYDITERILAEAQITRLAAVVEQAAESIIMTDIDGKIVYANRFVETNSGYLREEILNQNPRIFKSGVQSPQFYEELWQTIAAGKPWQGTFVNRARDGSLFHEEATIFPIKNEAGETINYAAVKRDVTAQVQLLNQVQAQAAQLQQILATVPEGVIVVDGNGRILKANPVAERYLSGLGVAGVDAIWNSLGTLDIPTFLSTADSLAPTEVITHDRIFQLNGQRITTEDDAKLYVLLLRDVTAEREQQTRIQEKDRLAAVGQLAAGIAHDFNNIMAIITLYAQLILHDTSITTISQNKLNTIVEQANRASDLIQQILDFSRRTVMERKPLNLVPFLKEQIKLLQRTLPETIKITSNFQDTAVFVEVDLTRIQQVMMNLALNARDAIDGYGELHIQLSSHTFASAAEVPLIEMGPGQWLSLAVSDNGKGMSTDVMTRIFEPFFTTKAPNQGTGLGLSQVYGIVQQHNGHIHVDSTPNVGTTFTIYLPRMVEPSQPARAIHENHMPLGHGETILLVEDDENIRTAVTDTLQLLNYHVIPTTNGDEALELVQQKGSKINLIISDAVMPHMGGVELLVALRKANNTIPFILISGYIIEEKMKILRQYEPLPFLNKPIQIHELAKTVSEQLHLSR